MLGPPQAAAHAHHERDLDGDRRSSRAPLGAQGEGRRRGGPRSSPRRCTIQFLATSFTERLRSRHRPSDAVLSAQTKDVERLEAIGDEIWAAAEHAFYNTNTISFKHRLRALRRNHPDKDFSTLTLLAIFDTEDPSSINAIPREEFIARVDAMKQKLRLPVWAPKPSKSEVAARRVEWEAGTPMFKHALCSVAFPEEKFLRNFYIHVSGHRPGKMGQQPTPVKQSGPYCSSKTACEDCQRWVQKVAEGSVSLESLETPGAGWVPSRDQVLGVAARVRAALPDITFGGVELPEVPGRKSKAAEPASAPRSKRARRALKKMED